MIVTFALQQDTGIPLASKRAVWTVESIRKHMPGATIIQLTNETYPALDYVDDVIREPFTGDFVDFLFKSILRASTRGESMLHIATDVLCLSSVEEVFNGDFDIAGCRYPIKTRADGAFCGDMKFIKPSGAGLFQEALDFYWSRPKIQDGWEGGQVAFREAAARTTLKVGELDHEVFCYTPDTDDYDITGKRMLHFRGKRKKNMEAAYNKYIKQH